MQDLDEGIARFHKDLELRQRNLVFPDTVRNEGVFYRTLADPKVKLNGVQRVGTAILVLTYIAPVVYGAYSTATGHLGAAGFFGMGLLTFWVGIKLAKKLISS